MSNFLVTSLVASVVLTLALNLLPRLFPKATQRAEQRVVQALEEQRNRESTALDSTQKPGNRPRVKVFFPWKWMLAGSVLLTVVVNIANWIG